MPCLPHSSSNYYSTSLKHCHLARLRVPVVPLSLPCVMEKKTVRKKTVMNAKSWKQEACEIMNIHGFAGSPYFHTLLTTRISSSWFSFFFSFLLIKLTAHYYHCLIYSKTTRSENAKQMPCLLPNCMWIIC